MKTEPDSRDFDALQLGKEAEVLLRHVEQYCAWRRETVLRSIFEVLRAKKPLDPQMAIQAWQDLFAVEAFRLDLEKKVRRGQQAGERLSPFMGENLPS